MLQHLLKTVATILVTSAVALVAAGSLDAQTVPKAKAKAATPAPSAKLVDLNKSTEKELEILPGVGPVTAKKIVAGRPYTSVDDLARAGVPARVIDGIRTKVVITAAPPTAPAPAAPARTKGATGAPARATAPATAPAVTTGPVDLNTATEAQLQSLPQVGPAIARAIIAGRPYTSVDDLDRVKGIGKARIAALRPLVTASGGAAPASTTATAPAATSTRPAAPRTAAGTRTATKAVATPAKPVNLNTASMEELETLPGIGPVHAKAIIDGRPYQTTEDVMKVKGIKEGIYSKIKGMITIK